jgi:hypothetical protein
MSATAALAIVLASCGLVRGGAREIGPEQFQFVTAPGGGEGAAADRMVDRFLGPDSTDRLIPGTASHVARTETPGGVVDLVRFQTLMQGRRSFCEGTFGEQGGSWGCGDAEPVRSNAAIETNGTSGSDQWSEVPIFVGSDVASVKGVASDGTEYNLEPANGVAYLMWPNDRGAVQLEALGSNGEVLGTVTVDPAGP